ncbi:hypothetical protein GH714_004379 [Hevea brasiliensis]|uniref:RRM domain-containing protein n=1 Tax=Hevea brasiliensis TaxID=3981 RepID=A0A6A6K3R1_HEVBR|nr:hypothetical protein GH714_004379 [Hevea brasiliensis]
MNTSLLAKLGWRLLKDEVSLWASVLRAKSSSRDVENPGNNLYVTGLSPRITKRDLEKHFASKGTVIDVHLVVDPWTRESRGFGFVTMSTIDEADRCIKYLDRSVLEGRVITVEKAKRRRGRTPTPGRYLGLRTIRGKDSIIATQDTQLFSSSISQYSPYWRSHSRSPYYSSDCSRSRSYSPRYSRHRSYSPYYSRRRSYSPHYSRRRSYSRSPYRRSHVSRCDRSFSPYDSRYYSPDDRYYRRYHHPSVSRSPTPPRTRRGSRRSYSSSISPRPRRSSRRSYSCSISPTSKRSSRSYSRSLSPRVRKSSKRSYSRSLSPKVKKNTRSLSYGGSSRREYSRDSYCRSPSASPISRSVSRFVAPAAASPSSW